MHNHQTPPAAHSSDELAHPEDLLRHLARTALQDVAPDGAVLRHMHLTGNRLYLTTNNGGVASIVWEGDLTTFRRIRVLGAGKGAAPMAQAVENLLGNRITDGLIVVKYGHGLADHVARRVRVLEGGHPVPDAAGADAAREILELAHECGEHDLILCLFTGGASALTPALCPGIPLDDMRTLTALLLESGATIHEINALRKHLSSFSGGGLVRAAFPATVLSLLVSDVVGDNLDVIASGPTVQDSTTFADCWRVMERYELITRTPQSILNHLRAGLTGNIPETPKAGDPAFARVRNVLVATVRQALESAAVEARMQGAIPRILTTMLTGEARVRAKELVAEAQRTQTRMPAESARICLLAGGETTVTIKGTGLGGRNQEMALAAQIALEGTQGIHMLCLGTDGTDGPTDAAGGFASSSDMNRILALGLDPHASLDNNDSHTFLNQTGRLVRTGPTRTNVMDIILILIDPLHEPPHSDF